MSAARPKPAGCGWTVWREETWPRQWLGVCETFCPGGIRCNSKADAEAFWNDGKKRCPLAAVGVPVTPEEPSSEARGV